MKLTRTIAFTAAGLFVSMQVASCGHLVGGFGAGTVDHDEAMFDSTDPSVMQKQSQTFLAALGGPMRAQHPESVLIGEARKVCHALYQGQSDDQVAKMLQTDLGSAVDTDRFSLAATIGFCPARAPG